MVEPPDNSTKIASNSSSIPTGGGIVLDIGTGDGLFVYQSARLNPQKFYIGIDPNPRPLEKISERVLRSRAKGGAENVLFLQASVEDLPAELDGLADEIHIHFPWGSLLGALATGDENVLGGLRRVCSPGALLEVIIGCDERRDRVELQRLKIAHLSLIFINEVLVQRYRQKDFQIVESGARLPSHWPDLKTSWARRLREGPQRSLLYFIARAALAQ